MTFYWKNTNDVIQLMKIFDWIKHIKPNERNGWHISVSKMKGRGDMKLAVLIVNNSLAIFLLMNNEFSQKGELVRKRHLKIFTHFVT
jgi:hypothetical protein